LSQVRPKIGLNDPAYAPSRSAMARRAERSLFSGVGGGGVGWCGSAWMATGSASLGQF
jgi:hypothetical protein